jgi:hypothetical protein
MTVGAVASSARKGPDFGSRVLCEQVRKSIPRPSVLACHRRITAFFRAWSRFLDPQMHSWSWLSPRRRRSIARPLTCDPDVAAVGNRRVLEPCSAETLLHSEASQTTPLGGTRRKPQRSPRASAATTAAPSRPWLGRSSGLDGVQRLMRSGFASDRRWPKSRSVLATGLLLR